MKRPDCETVCMAAMAREDGYISESPGDQLDAHLAECADCRKELGELRMISTLLDSHQRQQSTEDVWQRVASALPNPSTRRSTAKVWYPFLALSIILIIHRLVELIPDRDPGLLFKLAPLLLVVAVFSYLKENPFKINVALRLEGE